MNIENSCAFTGHRLLPYDFDVKTLENTIKLICKDGYDTFYVGMAVGFDMLCCKILLQLKQKYDIRIIACIPCLNQNERFNENNKKEYAELLEKVDEKVVLSERYYNGCMQVRNRYMVDRADLVVAYLKQNVGGTFATVNYAKTKNKKMIYIN